MNSPRDRNCAHGRLNRADRIQIGGDVQTFVGYIDSHLELLAAGHSFSAQLGVLQARITNKKSRVVICEAPSRRPLYRSVRRQINWRQRVFLLSELDEQ